MTSLSEQFTVIDGLRKAAGIAPARLAYRAGMSMFRYELILAGLKQPKRSEIAALDRALRSHPLPESRASRNSPSAGRMGKAPAAAVNPPARPGILSRAGER